MVVTRLIDGEDSTQRSSQREEKAEVELELQHLVTLMRFIDIKLQRLTPCG